MKKITKIYLIPLISILALIITTCVENHVLPNFGSIYLTSDPVGAEVVFNNEKKGVTPITLDEILSGNYTISINKSEFVDTTFDVQVSENQDLSYDIFLEEANPKGKISLTSDPSGAKIFINGVDTKQSTPSTFSKLTRGIYDIRLVLDLYDDSIFKIDLEKDEAVSKNTRLIISGSAGALFVTSNPTGANIFLDDFNTGKVTPDTLTPLATGIYSIKLSLESYRDTTVSATVTSGNTNNVNVDLTFYEPRGSITLDSNPQGAKIVLNNSETGLLTPSTIHKLEAGDYEVRLELNQYFDSTFTVTVIEDQNTNWPIINLVEIPFLINATVNPSDGGTVTGQGGYLAGAQATLEATPNTGYNFVNWTESGSVISTNPKYEFKVDKDRNLIANFELKLYQISASVNPDLAGSINGTGVYKHGDNVELSVSTNGGYKFINWTENEVEISADTSFSFIAVSDRNLIANFVEIGNLSVSSNPNGADIYINDSFSGKKTPAQFLGILAGDYTITLKLEDFADTSITTSIFSGETSEITDVFLRDITPDVDVTISYTVNQNQQLIFTFVFNQDVRFNRVQVTTPEFNIFNQNYSGVLLPEGIGISWTYPEKIVGNWAFSFFGSKVRGRQTSFEVTKITGVQ